MIINKSNKSENNFFLLYCIWIVLKISSTTVSILPHTLLRRLVKVWTNKECLNIALYHQLTYNPTTSSNFMLIINLNIINEEKHKHHNGVNNSTKMHTLLKLSHYQIMNYKMREYVMGNHLLLHSFNNLSNNLCMNLSNRFLNLNYTFET